MKHAVKHKKQYDKNRTTVTVKQLGKH